MNKDINVRGVNLGNWLVLEKWMSPSMFEGTSAEDEYYLAQELPHDIYEERIRRHRKEYITEHDFAEIARMGFNAVRIPIPYFIFGDREPFVGCIEELDHAFDWAERWNIKILIDLHTVPGSQNGFDNGGLCGVCKWAQMPEEVEFVLQLLEKLSKRYGTREGLWGIQPLNEPITTFLIGDQPWEDTDISKRYVARDPELAAGSAPISVDFLRQFYIDAYRVLRKHMSMDKYFVFHDGFGVLEWKDFMQEEEFQNVVLDSHMYLFSIEGGDWVKSPEGYKKRIQEAFAKNIEEMSKYFPVIVGEWCLDNSYAWSVQDLSERDKLYQGLAQDLLDTFGKGAGYFYWNYKLITAEQGLDCWDLRKSIFRGWFPEKVSAWRYSNEDC